MPLSRSNSCVDIDFTLRRIFKKSSFRPLQREVIVAALDGHDVFIQAATSFGKSLCFQLPAVIDHEVITIVISPLLSLMTDQVNALRSAGIAAGTINGNTPWPERQRLLADLESGHPLTRLLTVHEQRELARIAVDEAHYQVRQDVVQRTSTMKNRTENPERRAELEQKQERLDNVSGIIYTLFRQECENLASRLRHSGIGAKAYHAGLTHEEKTETLNRWINNDQGYDVIVATNSLWMGIDKENVRFVVHWQIPKSFEGFYQEAGRAGRDGKASIHIMYYSREDRDRAYNRVSRDAKERVNLEARVKSLKALVSYCEETDTVWSHFMDLEQNIRKPRDRKNLPTGAGPRAGDGIEGLSVNWQGFVSDEWSAKEETLITEKNLTGIWQRLLKTPNAIIHCVVKDRKLGDIDWSPKII
ncbi:hypothetical protein EYC84_001521 [Monilinia fructicola]|uniref:DNA 3'-5' helicase n=1 Tax=Monilinia fructicola TaxID=38448 RepID=A0A5M9JQK3_MONFR|nr:hypothetical protein EYC84_001521 [Monilinia fructicola]